MEQITELFNSERLGLIYSMSHALSVGLKIRESDWLKSLLNYWTLSFGGSTIVALLIAEPVKWLFNETILIIYFIAFFISRSNSAFLKNPQFNFSIFIGASFSTTNAIIDLGVLMMKGEPFTSILITGTLVGCGGGLILYLSRGGKEPERLIVPPLVATCVYVGLRNVELEEEMSRLITFALYSLLSYSPKNYSQSKSKKE